MTPEFSISTAWTSSNFGPPEVRETSGLLSIQLGNYIATRAEDDWSKTVQTSVRLSAYPLALWFAESWWRLLWEPALEGEHVTSTWRLGHDMSAAGHGFVWPRLVFESDGENMEVTSFQSTPTVTEPVRYLEGFRALTTRMAFERAVDEFVAFVIARLNGVHVRDSELQRLWQELKDERSDPDVAEYRRIEARLGFDPDDAPEKLVDELTRLMPELGRDAISEVAPACAGKDPEATLHKIINIASSSGVKGKICELPKLIGAAKSSAEKGTQPWERGRKLARSARSALSLGSGPLSDDEFSDLLGVPSTVLKKNGASGELPLGLAVRGQQQGDFKLVFRRHVHTGRRFEAARFLGDSLIAPVEDKWLPSTDAKTVRQKIQRAFAAEFLCPIEALVAFLDGDYSPEASDEAGEHFAVSPIAVRSQLANHGYIHPLQVGA
jgi:hypothetical protein